MQEARIKSLEADISKWKKKKEEVEIARKYDEDRFFKFKYTFKWALKAITLMKHKNS